MTLRDNTAKTLSDNKIAIFQSPQETRPLRECAEDALRKYFADLNGHAPGNLYAMVLSEVEPPLLKAVMNHTEGNQSKAAGILGLNRSTLRKKLRQYDLYH
ncbi:MAG TPA: DNA-binding transcriptional regulator Fis [Gammaproteobacteria bacterium]|nr:DNA-binding transcriptional regulator Fis [Gammaproteobacteria bacterium]